MMATLLAMCHATLVMHYAVNWTPGRRGARTGYRQAWRRPRTTIIGSR